MLNHLVFDYTNTTTSLPHSDVFTHDITAHVITVFILTIVDEAVTVRVVRAEGVLDGSTP
jgi:hypothetical protein